MPKCPSCKGKKIEYGIFPVYAEDVPKEKRKRVIEFPCLRCNGSGKVHRDYKKWIEDGEILKDRRIEKKIVIRQAAKLWRMSPSKLSEMERGVIKPDMRIHYDTIKVIIK